GNPLDIGLFFNTAANTFTNPFVNLSGSGSVVINNDMTFNGSPVFGGTGTGSLRFGGTVNLTTTLATSFSGRYDVTFAGLLVNNNATRALVRNRARGKPLTFADINLSKNATGRTLSLTTSNDVVFGGIIGNGPAGAAASSLTLTSSPNSTITFSGVNTMTG